MGPTFAPPPPLSRAARAPLSQLAVKLGRGLSEGEVDAAMSAMDADGDGSVTLEEFGRCVRARPRMQPTMPDCSGPPQ